MMAAGMAAGAVAFGATGVGRAQTAGTQPLLGKTTVSQTIAGGGRAGGVFGALSPAPGEPYVVREEGLGTAAPGRDRRRRSLVSFGQLTDFQLSDEESPARVEFLDSSADEPLNTPFGAAWRPQEALVAYMTDQAIRQVNAFATAGPVAQGDGSRAKLDFAISTGDSADSQQRNETEEVVRLLDGGEVVTNSGSSDPADYKGCPAGLSPDPQEAKRYTGVQDYSDGLPGSSFYDPDQPAGQFSAFPRYPGLMDRAQVPFQTPGLAVPSYVSFGNHDGLVQGNQAANASFEKVAVGCVKPFAPVPGLDGASTLAQGPLLLNSVPPKAGIVPPDPNRQYVSKSQYKALYRTGKQADGHGFGLIDPNVERASGGSAGYYAWDPSPGFRFIALDTISEGGVAGVSDKGNIDDPQFRWLQGQLTAAQAAGKLIVLFGHHPIRSMNAQVPDEVAPPCTGPDTHGHDANPGCDLDPRSSQPIHQGADLETLLKATPNVIGLVSGHTHENRVGGVTRPGGGGFWEIETSAEIDFPHQNRLLEVMDNRDGTLSIFGTVLDNPAPVTAPASGTSAAGLDTAQLASIGRSLGYNDPQSADPTDKGEVGGGGLGRARDRNVELLLKDPRAKPAQAPTAGGKGDSNAGTGSGGGHSPQRGARGVNAHASPATGDSGGPLPFTGLALAGILGVGAALLAAGVALSRKVRLRRG